MSLPEKEPSRQEREVARRLEAARGMETSEGRFWFTGNPTEIAQELAKREKQ